MDFTELGIFVVLSIIALLGILGGVYVILEERCPKYKRLFPGLVVVLLAMIVVDWAVIRAVIRNARIAQRTQYETSEYKEYMEE